jgi:type IV pilus biogenesis protein CpaD/CtpE
MKAVIVAVGPTLLLASLLALTGCSSAPKVQAQKPQYCNTNQTIAVRNGEKVDSITVLECTDDQIKRVSTARLGMSKNCGYFTGWMKKGGQDVQYRAISCQLPDGSWEVVDTYN